MATKNNLAIGSSFSAYSTKLSVVGIFQTTNKALQNSVILNLPALEQISGNSNAVTSATVTVDSVDNLTSTTAKVQQTLGSSADVVSAVQQATTAIGPLNNVKTVATFSLIGAVIAGSVIILLTMVMVVRERKQEIGVLKAIGASNLRIIGEFVVESLTLAIFGAVIGLAIGIIGAQPVTTMLVSTSNNSTSISQARGHGFGGANGPFARTNPVSGLRRNLSNIQAQIGWPILLEGFGTAIFISLVGSALSAVMISKVRPSTVMRAI